MVKSEDGTCCDELSNADVVADTVVDAVDDAPGVCVLTPTDCEAADVDTDGVDVNGVVVTGVEMEAI